MAEVQGLPAPARPNTQSLALGQGSYNTFKLLVDAAEVLEQLGRRRCRKWLLQAGDRSTKKFVIPAVITVMDQIPSSMMKDARIFTPRFLGTWSP